MSLTDVTQVLLRSCELMALHKPPDQSRYINMNYTAHDNYIEGMVLKTLDLAGTYNIASSPLLRCPHRVM
jgi:hypothetical protein